MSATLYKAGTVGELRKILDGIPDHIQILRRFDEAADRSSDVIAPVAIELLWTGRPRNAHLVRIGGCAEE